MLMKTVWSVVCLQARVTLRSPKAWVALLLGLLMAAASNWDILSAARQAGYSPLQIQVVELAIALMSTRPMHVFTVVGVALMLSDAPFANMNTPYLVFRTRRRAWMVGNAVYMLIASFAYVLFIIIACALISTPFSYVQNFWSPFVQKLAEDRSTIHSKMGGFVDWVIVQYTRPYQACAWQYALLALYSFCVSGIMLLVNTVQKRSAGFAAAMLFHGLMLVMYMDAHPIGRVISLFTHAMLDVHLGEGIATIPLGMSVLVFLAVSALWYGLSAFFARRLDI
jgi:hypothetical protein